MPEEFFEILFPNQSNNKNDIEFRNSSDIQIEKKPCPCMANKVKEIASSSSNVPQLRT